MSEFNFGDLDEKRDVPSVDVDELMRKLTSEIDRKIKAGTMTRKQIQDLIKNQVSGTADLAKIKKDLEEQVAVWKGTMIDFNNAELLRFQKEIKAELEGYKESLGELWEEVYPTLIKMWGTSRGIGRKVSKIDQLIRQ
jgi:hypothetical protein